MGTANRETVPFGRPIGELILALAAIAFGLWTLTLPEIPFGLRVLTCIMLAAAAGCGFFALIDCIRPKR